MEQTAQCRGRCDRLSVLYYIGLAQLRAQDQAVSRIINVRTVYTAVIPSPVTMLSRGVKMEISKVIIYRRALCDTLPRLNSQAVMSLLLELRSNSNSW